MTLRTHAHIRPQGLAAPLDVLAGRGGGERGGGEKEGETGGERGDNLPEGRMLESGFSSMGKS